MLVVSNEKLLENEKIYEIKILKLKAKISEPRKVSNYTSQLNVKPIFSCYDLNFDR